MMPLQNDVKESPDALKLCLVKSEVAVIPFSLPGCVVSGAGSQSLPV